MNQAIKQEIQNYLNSFGDEELTAEQMQELFCQANQLLRQVVDDDDASEEFVVATINRQDLIDFGYDASDLSDDDMQSIASRMDKAYHEGYCDCWGWDLCSAAEYLGIPKQKRDPDTYLADTAGKIVSFEDGADVYYVGDVYNTQHHNGGVVYKHKQAFEDQVGICYIPQCGFFTEDDKDKVSEEMTEWLTKNVKTYPWYVCDDSGYTYGDLLDCVHNAAARIGCLDKYKDEFLTMLDRFYDHVVTIMFNELDWQSPETFLEEYDFLEEWYVFLDNETDDKRLTDKQKKGEKA